MKMLIQMEEMTTSATSGAANPNHCTITATIFYVDRRRRQVDCRINWQFCRDMEMQIRDKLVHCMLIFVVAPVRRKISLTNVVTRSLVIWSSSSREIKFTWQRDCDWDWESVLRNNLVPLSHRRVIMSRECVVLGLDTIPRQTLIMVFSLSDCDNYLQVSVTRARRH